MYRSEHINLFLHNFYHYIHFSHDKISSKSLNFKSSFQTFGSWAQVHFQVILAFCVSPREPQQQQNLEPPNSDIWKYCILLRVYAFFTLGIFMLILTLSFNIPLVVQLVLSILHMQKTQLKVFSFRPSPNDALSFVTLWMPWWDFFFSILLHNSSFNILVAIKFAVPRISIKRRENKTVRIGEKTTGNCCMSLRIAVLEIRRKRLYFLFFFLKNNKYLCHIVSGQDSKSSLTRLLLAQGF